MHTRLKDVLREREISYDKLAESTGLSPKTIYNAANGGTLNRSTQLLIANELKEDPATLFAVVHIPEFIKDIPVTP